MFDIRKALATPRPGFGESERPANAADGRGRAGTETHRLDERPPGAASAGPRATPREDSPTPAFAMGG